MAKGKKGKKGKKEKKPQEKEYKLLTLEEVRALETKFVNRLLNLKMCTSKIEEAIMEAEEIQEGLSTVQEWDTYLLCDGLPKPFIPPDIRLFYAKLRFFEQVSMEKYIDWLLSVNERSILTQDIFNKDRTRRALVTELRPTVGAEYQKNVQLLLRVLHDIECFLDLQTKSLSLPPSIIADILEQKKAIHQEILDFFDRYTYRVLSAEDSFLDSVDPITSEYFYSCDIFNIHLWALKNVPVLFEFLETPVLLANLHCLKVTLQLPLSALEENLSIRAVHYKFDHFSDHAKSFDHKATTPTEMPIGGIIDLYDCLVHEWQLQQTIQTEVRNKMIERRLDYEEKLRLYNEEQERIKKAKEKAPKKSKQLKLPKEVPKIGDNEFPEVWDDFLEREREECEKFLKTVYHPDVLELTYDEINMKKYHILGGIYQFNFVIKPIHYKFRSFNMTYHINNGQLKIDNSIKVSRNNMQSSSATSMRQPQMPLASFHSRSMWAISATSIAAESSPYFVLTIELPSQLCLFGDPKPCHFEADLIEYVNKTSTDAQANAKAPIPTQTPANQPQPPPPGTVAVAPDYLAKVRQSLDIGPERQPHLSATYSNIGGIITRPSITNFFRPSLITLQSMALRQVQVPAKPSSTTINLDDFRLDKHLTKFQIRELQRHCLPRIISSFKFPKELKEDSDEMARNKPKTRGGGLIRKRTSVEDNEDDPGFTLENQNNPERLFPHYPHAEAMQIMYQLAAYNTEIRPEEPETFSALIETLNNIKTNYCANYKLTQDTPKFKPRVDLRKLRLMMEDQAHTTQKRMSTEDDTGSILSVQSHTKLSKLHNRKKRKSLDSKFGRSTDRLDTSRRDFQRIAVSRSEVAFSLIDHERDERDHESGHEEDAHSTEADTRETYTYSHWTTKHIIQSKFDRKNSRITIWTDRLGTIGLAFKRYDHFPFQFWSMKPNIESTEPEIVFTLDTKFVTCVIFVSTKGYRGYAAEQMKKYVRNRAMYLTIDEPLADLKAVRKQFRDCNINIFSDHDASFYIEKGYFSEKHLAAEMHTYSCMALNCLFIKFEYSQWNRLAKRRDILFHFVQHREPDENKVLVRITPEDATFVEVTELCSDKLDDIKLDYTLTWRNIDHYPDLQSMIPSMYLSAVAARVKDAKLIINVRNLLSEIRPLSYA